MLRNHYKSQRSLYIQREILTRITNGILSGPPKNGSFGTYKPSQVFPFENEKNEMEEIKKLMDEDPAFKPGMVYLPGKGFIHKSEINGNGNTT